MIQDIAPHLLNNHYDVEARATKDDYFLIINNGDIIANVTDDTLSFPKGSDLNISIDRTEAIYLFSIDDKKYYLYQVGDDSEIISDLGDKGFIFRAVKSLRGDDMHPKYDVFAANTAKHLADWYRDSQFCGRCGNRMKHSEMERAMVCSDCGNTVYPRIMPAVIVGVINEDKMLITRYRRGYGNNALVAGFTEIGETLEETVSREVMEEAGIMVKNIRYYKSQPWGIANDILVGFFCDLDGDSSITIDDNELKYAEWVRREDIVLQPDNFSLTNEMMRIFKEYK